MALISDLDLVVPSGAAAYFAEQALQYDIHRFDEERAEYDAFLDSPKPVIVSYTQLNLF